jgi:hypothetical protein
MSINWNHLMTLIKGSSHSAFAIGMFLTESSHSIVNTIIESRSKQDPHFWRRMSATRPLPT